MSEITADTTLFDAATPPTPEPPPQTQDPLTQSPPWDQIVGAINSGFDRLASRQDSATSAQAAPAMPATWWETLTPEQQAKVNEQALLNSGQTNAFIAQQEAEYSRRRMIQDAAPIIAAQGSTFVELFKARKARQPYYEQIEPLFDRMLAGVDLRPLVNMTPQVRDSELEMRWRAATADIQEKILKNPPRPEPTLTTTSGPAPVEGPVTVETDQLLAAMDAVYQFTPEQKAALEAASKE